MGSSPEKKPAQPTKSGQKSSQKPKEKTVKEFELKINLSEFMNKGLIYVVLAILFIPFLFTLLSPNREEITLSQFVTDLREEQIEKVTIVGDELRAQYAGEEVEKFARKETSTSVTNIFDSAGIDLAQADLKVENISGWRLLGEAALSFLPLLLMIGFFFFLFRQARGGQDGIMGIGRSKAKVFIKGKQNTKFADVGGMDEAKKELEEIVDFLKHPKKYQKVGARTPKGVLLVGPAGTGKCVTGDTLITTNKGLIPIEEIPRYYFVDTQTHMAEGAQLASFNVESTTSLDTHASHWYDLGEQTTIKIALAQGFALEGTPEHPLVVMTEKDGMQFKQIQTIAVGDWVAVQYGRQMFGTLDVVDVDTAYLMGLLTGDGNLSHSSRVGLTSVDEDLIAFFRSYVMSRYPTAKITQNKQSYLVASWDFKKYLYTMGMSYLLSFDKTIPPTILQAPQTVQRAFLQGLFDTDASVGKSRADFEYTTVSQTMARQVHMMLLNMGVVTSLNQKGKVSQGYHRPVYRIAITGVVLKTFAELVGFRLPHKKQLLAQHVNSMGRSNTNIDVIPGVSHLIMESWQYLSERKLSHEQLSKTVDKVRRRGRVSRSTLTEFVQYAKQVDATTPHVDYLEKLLQSQLFFAPVLTTVASRNRVFDFTVPDTHSFLGNGLINHNTLLARAVAGEANVQFLSIAGSEFMEMLVGVGASRVRDLFATAKKLAPSIIFIDEIDAIGRARGMGSMGGHDEREQTLNQILVEMDGFTPNDNVIVMAATNRGDMLDPALVRPGRFDRRVTVNLPDLEERKFILSIHAKGKPFAKEVNWDKVAKRTVGFSGADIENMLNEAAIAVARQTKDSITMADIEEASLKVKLGPSKKRLTDEYDRRMTAYHEAGHAVIAHVSPYADPVHRISIVSRGSALGFTLTPPERDKVQTTKSELIDEIAVLLGGRAAELLIFNELTAGASSDIERATKLARAMVTDFGMSDLGPMQFSPQYESVDYRRTWGEPSKISDRLQQQVDAEVKKFVDTGMAKAIELLKTYDKQLHIVSEKLLESESLDGDEFTELMGMPKATKETIA